MSIAVIAGTPTDTQMGVILLEKNNIPVTLSVAVSRNPIEQTHFQTLSLDKKMAVMHTYFKQFSQQKITHIFVYCNSLSAAIAFDTLAKHYQLTVITPMHVYQTIAKDYTRLAVIAANAQGLAGIERTMIQANEHLQLFNVSLLELVKAIEQKESPEKLIHRFSLPSLCHYFEQLSVEALVIGCTHFPYVQNELAKYTQLPIINPDDIMIQLLKNHSVL